MREFVEFRVVEKFAGMLLSEHEGKRLGTLIRKIELETSDPRYARIGELDKELKLTKGKFFFHGWSLTHQYDAAELSAASLFRLQISSVFEPSGEECGTEYDETAACPRCGAGAKQVGPLILNTNRIPKTRDISRTIAGEIVVSRRFVDVFMKHRITGAHFMPLRMNRSSSAESQDWFQFSSPSISANVIPPTRVGIDPFDLDLAGKYRCVLEDLIGLNLLSETTVSLDEKDKADVMLSRQYIGVRRGLLRPERMIFISPRAWRVMQSEMLKGAKVEVAHIGEQHRPNRRVA